MESSANKFSKFNDSIIKVLEKPIIKYGSLIVIISHIIAIKQLSTSYLEIFDINYFKLIYAFIIVYYSCFDPIYSIALTSLMIISIQELHSRNSQSSSMSLLQENKTNKMNNMNNMNSSNKKNLNKSINNFINSLSTDTKTSKVSNSVIIDDDLIYDTINKQSLQKQPSPDDNLKHEYEFCDEPAYKTITNNLNEETIDQNIVNNQNISIQGIQGINGDIDNIQGLPNGYDVKKANINFI